MMTLLVEHLPGKHDQQTHGRHRGPILSAQQAYDELVSGQGHRLGSGHIHPEIAAGSVHDFMEIAADGSAHPDLTELKVSATLKFGEDGLGIARKDMPQLPEGDQRAQYFADLQTRGVKVTTESIDPRMLRPIQKEISAKNAGLLMREMESGGYDENNHITVSRDNYVLDGHHRWGGKTALAFSAAGTTITVDRVDMSVEALLVDASSWTKAQGIAGKEMGADLIYHKAAEAVADALANAHARRLVEMAAGQPRDARGRWSKGGGGWGGKEPSFKSEGSTKYPGVAGGPDMEALSSLRGLKGADLSALEPDQRERVVARLNTLAEDYPNAAAKIKYVATEDLQDGVTGATGPAEGGDLAVIFDRTAFSAAGESGIITRDQAFRLEAQSQGRDDLVNAMPVYSSEWTVSHEFGHVLQYSGGQGAAQLDMVATMMLAPVTFYGAQAGAHEQIADAFAITQHPESGSKLPAQWKQIVTALERVGNLSESLLDRISALLVEHLMGQHNQQTHGRGGTSGYLARDLAAHGGGSYEARGLKVISHGTVVARSGHSGVFERERFLSDAAYRKTAVDAFMRDNRSEFASGGQLGTWDSGTEGGASIVFDVIDVVSRQKAIRLGKARGEDGVFDLDKGEYVPTGGKTYT